MQKIKTGIIPAAGESTRIGYLSKLLPKSLMPVYDKPVIHHIVDKMVDVGVEKIYIIVGYQKEKITDYFRQTAEDIEIPIEFIVQEKRTGIADALMLARRVITEPFLVILGDDCTITDSLRNITDLFEKTGAIVVEGVIPEEDPVILRSTCCLRVDDERRIIEIIEKPADPAYKLRGCGIYAFHPDIFDYIERTPPSGARHEVQITDAIGLAAREGRAYGEFIDGVNININSYNDLLQAWLAAKERFGK